MGETAADEAHGLVDDSDAATGDDERFAGIYERCARPITAYCSRRLSAERVDDAVAETFLVAWRRLDDVPSGREELLWLYRVAGNVVRHEWRSAARRRRLDERVAALPPEPAVCPDERIESRERGAVVQAALERLDPEDAQVLMLTAWERLRPAEMGPVLGISANAASQRASRARKRLAVAIDELSVVSWCRPVDEEQGR